MTLYRFLCISISGWAFPIKYCIIEDSIIQGQAWPNLKLGGATKGLRTGQTHKLAQWVFNLQTVQINLMQRFCSVCLSVFRQIISISGRYTLTSARKLNQKICFILLSNTAQTIEKFSVLFRLKSDWTGSKSFRSRTIIFRRNRFSGHLFLPAHINKVE